MKKTFLVLLMVLMTIGLVVSCKSDPEIKYVTQEVNSNQYMLKQGMDVSTNKLWCSGLVTDVTTIKSITFTDTKPSTITTDGVDMTIEGTGKVMGYSVEDTTDSGKYNIYIVGEKILANYFCSGMFYSCTSLTSIDFGNLDTSKVTSMSGMFSGCTGLTSIDFGNLDTSKVTDMSYMFYGCTGLTSIDFGNLDTSKVTDMSYMFHTCSGLTSLDLSKFDTSKVTSMFNMFFGCSNLTTVITTENTSYAEQFDLAGFTYSYNTDKYTLSYGQT